jgi:hypothetical protein
VAPPAWGSVWMCSNRPLDTPSDLSHHDTDLRSHARPPAASALTGATKFGGSPHAPILARLPIIVTRALRHLRHSSAVSVMQGLPSYSW